MTRPLDPHEPRPEFVSHLEWEIRSALRQESRPASPAPGLRRLRTAALIAASVLIGAAGAIVSAEIQDARQRDLMTLTADTERQILTMRYQLAKEEYDNAMRRVQMGTAGRETLAVTELQYREIGAMLRRLNIDVAEMQATSQAPRDGLDAPVVKGRDFVRERLTLALEMAQHRVSLAQEALRSAAARVQAGTARDTSRMQAEVDLTEAQNELHLIAAKIDLRQRFVRGELRAEALASRLRRTELTLAYDRLGRELALARERLIAVQRQIQAGLASQLDLKRAEIAVLELELEAKRIQTELDALGRER